ncbi:MAG: SAM-dependent DNA methyltransferase [Ignavibacteriae bacterium]|nr:SAM-dependent DNA methyltransferase [Ignavibacteriota bacterium]
MNSIEAIEIDRLERQIQLDSEKSHAERNRQGQFATPPGLAAEIVRASLKMLTSEESIRFLDPAFGTGSFYSALLKWLTIDRLARAQGFEIDEHYGRDASSLWKSTPLQLTIANFFELPIPLTNEERSNLLVCNPPYIRHHHFSQESKEKLQRLIGKYLGLKLNGLAGLYCYFLLHAHNWLADGGLACWLVPSEFMDVNYGREVKKYLREQVTLLRLHRFDIHDVQFDDALVSSVVIWFKKSPPQENSSVDFTFGGSLSSPTKTTVIPRSALNPNSKWSKLDSSTFTDDGPSTGTTLSDLFQIKRGLATGANSFFILTPEEAARYQIPAEFLRPILPSPRYVDGDEILADESGNPILEKKLFLLDCKLSETHVKQNFAGLWAYLEMGKQKGIHAGYICTHRSPWYSQENRPPAPLLCTYMGRSDTKVARAFRFLLNHSQACAANVYLMLYPQPFLLKAIDKNPELLRRLWDALNSIPVERLIHSGRSYGGGLHKLEPKELAQASADLLMHLLPPERRQDSQSELFDPSAEGS